MPLTPTEANQFVQAFQQALAGFVARPGEPVPAVAGAPQFDRLMASAERFMNLLTRVGDALVANLDAYRPDEPDTSLTGDQTAPAPRKRGPKPRNSGAVADGQTQAPGVAPGATGAATTATLPLPSGTPATHPPQAIQGQPVDDIFSEPQKAAPAPNPLEEEIPGFLQRQQAGTAPAPLTQEQVKEVLRDYMVKFGEQGTTKLTALLTRVGGVKRFSELPPDKWPAMVTAARQELAT